MKFKFKLEYIIILVLLSVLFLSGYSGSIRLGLIDAGDLPLQEFLVSKNHYLSKYHIWYESFSYFSFIILFLIPPIISKIYADNYFNNSDIYKIYRTGLKQHLYVSFFKSLLYGLIFSIFSLGLYWILLNITPTTNLVFVEGMSSDYETIISPMIITNEFVKELVVESPNNYIYLMMSLVTLGVVSYSAFVFAVGNFIKSKYARYIIPLLILLLVDLLINSILFSLPDSLLFGIFNPMFNLSIVQLILPSMVVLIISGLLVMIHYRCRVDNG